MQGTIDVYEYMRRRRHLKEWRARVRRDQDWEALKLWWSAQRRVRRASTPADRRRAQAELAKTIRLYHRELRRILPKWRRAQRALREGRYPEG